MMNRKMEILYLITAAAFMSGCGSGVEQPSYDVLIVNGTVYDGSLSEPVRTNIGIVGDRIVAMGADAGAEANTVIDAAGLVVTPGFIDPHTHAEEDLFNANYLTQGVSTVFIGNDGGEIDDRDTQLATLRNQGTGTNVGWYSGHGTARQAVMGLENRASTEEELDEMREFVEADMRAGALGLSTGLFYRPGSYAETDEVIELARVAARYGGVYDSHLRDESSYSIGLLGAIREAIQIGEEAGLPVHIAHLKALGRDVWGQSGDIIGIISAARERGLDVTADQYPWRASGTSLRSSLIPRWAMADSQEAMLERLENADLQDRIREEMEANLWRRGGAESLLITGDSEWRGMTLDEIAAEMGVDPIEAAIEVVRAGNPNVASFNMNPDDINAIAIQPWVMTGSDGSFGHPRKYASYPKAYRDFVVNTSLMNMQRFVHRSSGLVADTFGLCDRGYIREGRKADITLIDTETYLPVAGFENPTDLSTGVVYMLVNGEVTIADRELAQTLAGDLIDLQNLDCE
jgi:N-acyl-D-amino-acid deacylase